MLQRNYQFEPRRTFRKRDYETCKEVAAFYKSRSELRHYDNSIYKQCLKEGWLDEFYPYKDQEPAKPKPRPNPYRMERPIINWRQVSLDNDPMRQLFTYLKEKKLTQKHIAERAGVNQNTLTSWKKGYNRPNLIEFGYVCEAARLRIVLVPEDEIPGR